MRIADAVASLASQPDAVLVGNDAADRLARRVGEQLGLPVAAGRPDDGRAVVVLVAVEQVDVDAALEEAMGRAGALRDTEHCLVVVDADRDGLPVAATSTAAATHGLELVAVRDVAHPVFSVALDLVPAEEADLAAARTELRLEREVSRRARMAVDATAHELDRRGERIDALRREVTELRERVETLEVHRDREVEDRERELVVLRREVGQLEASTSYRIGNALVRILKDPRLLLRVPARLLRRLRS